MRSDPDPVTGETRRLINIAYRLLGSLAEAEDAVQEAFARWYALPSHERGDVESPGAWLTTVTSRICLDVLGSARSRRERYVGPWLPEPLPGAGGRVGGATAADPADLVTLDESVGMAYLVLLDAMTPAERVAFVLHDVFRYSFAEIARVVGRSEAACRQLASSARRRLRGSPAVVTPPAERAATVRDFKLAWDAKDIEALVGLLDPDVTVVADGGGLVRAHLHPVRGVEEVTRLCLDILGTDGLTLGEQAVNGQPGLVARQDGVVVTVFAVEVSGSRISRIWAVRNPEKLRPWRSVR